MISAWARICQILGDEFHQYLPMVMGPLMKAASFKCTWVFNHIVENKIPSKFENRQKFKFFENYFSSKLELVKNTIFIENSILSNFKIVESLKFFKLDCIEVQIFVDLEIIEICRNH